jgi:hypothetical protein
MRLPVSTSRLQIHVPGDMRAAERLYLQDLPELLRTKPGDWIAYSAQGRIAQGPDEMALFQLCFTQGLRRGQFLVARIEPDAPSAAITESWNPLEGPEARDHEAVSQGS